MKTYTFLCSRCLQYMCQDCINIANEYIELENNRKLALITANDKLERITKELNKTQRKAKMYEDCAKAGITQIIGAWMDNNIKELLK